MDDFVPAVEAQSLLDVLGARAEQTLDVARVVPRETSSDFLTFAAHDADRITGPKRASDADCAGREPAAFLFPPAPDGARVDDERAAHLERERDPVLAAGEGRAGR